MNDVDDSALTAVDVTEQIYRTAGVAPTQEVGRGEIGKFQKTTKCLIHIITGFGPLASAKGAGVIIGEDPGDSETVSFRERAAVSS
ncbi:hypothetical protein [Arthrobacter oryzae]|uniref:hypothetical protein n=1 Tax=Arthrobacter oryzae TaxID=409290 RepID=UPI00273B5E87|nr:hypothetical protein [Arthrobacter oryzae]WLQ05051.1 hypothetical protein Q8Z05_12920 [Arthrobacter oryzae]